MKNGNARLILSAMFASFFFIFANQAYAYNEKGRHVSTDCPPCEKYAKQYNEVADELANAEQTLDDIRKSIQVDNQFIQKDKARIAEIESMPPSPKKDEALQQANKSLDNDESDLRKHEKDESNQLKAVFKLIDKRTEIEKTLADCEDWYCGSEEESYYAPSYNPFVNYFIVYSQLVQVQLALMVGNMPGYRTAHIMDFDTDFSDSNTSNSADLGLQAKFLFGNPKQVKPTITLNADRRLNSTNTIWRDGDSKLQYNNDWIIRGLVGAESPPFLTNFTAGASVGVAVFDQSIKSTIGALNANKNTTSIGPSLLANLTYNACSNCLLGHPLSISGQVIADHYPDITARNGFVSATVKQKWQVSENLVFSTSLGR